MYKIERGKDKNHNITVTVIVPAYFEEKTIPNLLQSLNNQQFGQFEVIVVNNGSKDRTKDVVQSFKNRTNYSLTLLDEPTPGPGHARRKGMNEVITRDSLDLSCHYLVTTDADVIPPPNWLEEIVRVFEQTKCGACGGPHTADPKIDQLIAQRMGIDDYFTKIARINGFLAQSGIGKIKLSGPNAAFSAKAYLETGGIEQPYDQSGRISLKEVTHLTEKIRRKGYLVAPVPVTVISSRRRHLLELIKQRQLYFSASANNSNRFLTVRLDEQRILEYALQNVSLESWLNYQKSLILAVLDNIVFSPIANREISCQSLSGFLSNQELVKLCQDVKNLGNRDGQLLAKRWYEPMILYLEQFLYKN